MKRAGKIFTYLLILLGCVGTFTLGEVYHISRLDTLSIIITVAGVLLVAVELYQSRKISEADFLSDLNQSFVSNEDYKNAYMLFENYDFDTCPDLELQNCHISNYLTFFEVFKLLIDNGTLSIKTVNDLFGYRFFLAVHNPYVQKQKLVKSPHNFRNLYILERDWMAYRRKNNMPIFHEEYALQKQIPSALYQEILSGKAKK